MGDATHEIATHLTVEAKTREPHSIIIAEAKKCAKQIVWIGLTPVNDKLTMPFENGIYFKDENTRRYDETISTIASVL